MRTPLRVGPVGATLVYPELVVDVLDRAAGHLSSPRPVRVRGAGRHGVECPKRIPPTTWDAFPPFARLGAEALKFINLQPISWPESVDPFFGRRYPLCHF